ncbi:MAG: hypothetical protein H6828_12175 [Planctomycetes bacterium]|nr:hypothetical protein [Planctomycetota bacterium]
MKQLALLASLAALALLLAFAWVREPRVAGALGAGPDLEPAAGGATEGPRAASREHGLRAPARRRRTARGSDRRADDRGQTVLLVRDAATVSRCAASP